MVLHALRIWSCAIAGALMTILASGASGADKPARPKPVEWAPSINWARLVADPQKFDGQRIVISGWIIVGYDHEMTPGLTLYLNEEALKFRDGTASMSLEIESLRHFLPEERYMWQLLNGEHVRVQGVLKLNKEEYENSGFLGTLVDIHSFTQDKEGNPRLPRPR